MTPKARRELLIINGLLLFWSAVVIAGFLILKSPADSSKGAFRQRIESSSDVAWLREKIVAADEYALFLEGGMRWARIALILNAALAFAVSGATLVRLRGHP